MRFTYVDTFGRGDRRTLNASFIGCVWQRGVWGGSDYIYYVEKMTDTNRQQIIRTRKHCQTKTCLKKMFRMFMRN